MIKKLIIPFIHLSLNYSYADIVQVATIESKERVKHIYSNLDRLSISKEHIFLKKVSNRYSIVLVDDIKYLDDIRKYYDDATLVPDYVLETKTNIVEKEVFIEKINDNNNSTINVSNSIKCIPCDNNQTTFMNNENVIKEENKVLKYYEPNDLWIIIKEKKYKNNKQCLDLIKTNTLIFMSVNQDVYKSFNNLFVEFCEEKKEE